MLFGLFSKKNRDKIKYLESELKYHADRGDRNKAAIDVLEKKLKTKTDELTAKFLEEAGTNIALTITNDRLNKQLEELKSLYIHANDQLNLQLIGNDSLSKANDILKEECKDIENLKNKYSVVFSEVNQLNNEKAYLESDNEELKKKLEVLEAENVALKTNSQFLTEKIFNIEDLAKAIIASLDV